MTFSATVKTGDEHEVLVHHADAGSHRVARAGEVLDLVVQEDLALVGGVQAVQDVHQRGLAGAVLPEQAVDLARLDDEVDVVVRDERPEALGDASKLEPHVLILGDWSACGRATTRGGEATQGLPAASGITACVDHLARYEVTVDLAVDDVLLQLLDLGPQRRVDLALEVVQRGEAHATRSRACRRRPRGPSCPRPRPGRPRTSRRPSS